MIPAEVICTVQHAQEMGFCVRGQRKMWQTYTDRKTFEDFIHNGVSAAWLLSTGNPYAEKLANYVLSKYE